MTKIPWSKPANPKTNSCTFVSLSMVLNCNPIEWSIDDDASILEIIRMPAVRSATFGFGGLLVSCLISWSFLARFSQMRYQIEEQSPIKRIVISDLHKTVYHNNNYKYTITG